MKTVIVTGAFGFLGRYTSRVLAREGFRVVGIGHGNWKREEWSQWGLSAWSQREITLETLRSCGTAPYAIIHLAGGSSVQASLINPFKDFERSVLTVACVLEFIRTVSPRTKLVYPSSAGVYGNADRIPIPESSPMAPVSPYGLYKSLCEQMVRMYSKQYSVAASVIRFFSLYGCGLRKQLLWDGCNKLASGDASFMGTGRELRDWLHVEDGSGLIRIAMEHASVDCPIVNGGTGLGVSVREILAALARGLQAESEPNFNFLGTQKVGDPIALVADTTLSKGWGWEPQRFLAQELAEYVAWWRSDNPLNRTVPDRSEANIGVLQASVIGAS